MSPELTSAINAASDTATASQRAAIAMVFGDLEKAAELLREAGVRLERAVERLNDERKAVSRS